MTSLRREGLQGGVDWAEMRRRVDEAGKAVAGLGQRSAEQTRALLEERARRLAQPGGIVHLADAPELVTFALGGETYAIELKDVAEVCRRVELAFLPAAEPPVLAVTSWRGELLTVIDLRSTLGLPPRPPGSTSPLLVLRRGAAIVGLAIDAPGELVARPAAPLAPPSPGTPGAGYIRGLSDGAIVVLDIEALLRFHA